MAFPYTYGQAKTDEVEAAIIHSFIHTCIHTVHTVHAYMQQLYIDCTHFRGRHHSRVHHSSHVSAGRPGTERGLKRVHRTVGLFGNGKMAQAVQMSYAVLRPGLRTAGETWAQASQLPASRSSSRSRSPCFNSRSVWLAGYPGGRGSKSRDSWVAVCK
ncbi:hypothetical protein BGZ63DRAFT_371761 [Mariannaea sp. PMI_226]|nr:hypothetical protein BGZ63DRAFT_371761 [Mariannaea sp. PMI_226]